MRNPSTLSPNKSHQFSNISTIKNKSSKITSSPSQINNNRPDIDTFSISAKHPYLHLSPDLRTVTKTSHSGHRFAALGAKMFSED